MITFVLDRASNLLSGLCRLLNDDEWPLSSPARSKEVCIGGSLGPRLAGYMFKIAKTMLSNVERTASDQQASQSVKKRRRHNVDKRLQAPSFSLDPHSETLLKELYCQADAISLAIKFDGLEGFFVFCQENADTGGRRFMVSSIKTSYRR